MSEQSKSPVLEFLTKKDNMQGVLEVLRYGIQIRKRVAERFWMSLENSFRACQPANLSVDLLWRRYVGAKKRDLDQLYAGLKDDYRLSLDAWPGRFSDESQGVKFRIESYHDYFGFGLCWQTEVQNLESLCSLPPMQALCARIKEMGSHELILEPEPNEYWVWWASWESDIYENEPWFWYAQERDSAWFENKAKSFWKFVELTYGAVIEANKTLKTLNQSA